MKPKSLRNYVPILPLCIFLVITLGYPLFLNLFYSVSDVSFQTIRNPSFSKNFLSNYSDIMVSKPFWESFLFSSRFALLATVLEVSLGLFLAILLTPLIQKKKILLIFILLPLMISPALMGIMYRLLLNDFVGIIPQYLQLLGIQIDLLNPPWQFWTLLGIEVLQWTPFVFLIIFAGLQGISDEILDAGKVDGANSLKLFVFIILPCLIPFVAISTLIRFVDSFRVFDHIYVLTGGGPGRSTTSMSIFIYKTFFQQEQIGQAVAASMILMIMFLTPLIISMKNVVRKH